MCTIQCLFLKKVTNLSPSFKKAKITNYFDYCKADFDPKRSIQKWGKSITIRMSVRLK